MGGDQAVFGAEQGLSLVQGRLLVEYVDAGPGDDASGGEYGHQSGLFFAPAGAQR